MDREFDRQVSTLFEKGYAAIAGLETEVFRSYLEPLRTTLRGISKPASDDSGKIPFVIVVGSDLVPVEKAMSLVELKGKPGFVNLFPKSAEDFSPTPDLSIPTATAYLVLDIDTGKSTLDVTPDDALVIIRQAERDPITIAEGVAVVTHFPEVLKTRNCFSTLGSRCGDRRVPAIWLSTGRPRLGWCWAGNPHTWLGSASCGGRAGPGREFRSTKPYQRQGQA